MIEALRKWLLANKISQDSGVCAKFQNDLTIEEKVIGKQYFMRFELKKSFGWMAKLIWLHENMKKIIMWKHKPKITITQPVNVHAVYSKMYLS